MDVVKGGEYIPLWVSHRVAHEILAKHSKDNGVILHPGIRLRNPSPGMPAQPAGATPWMEDPDIYKALNTDAPGIIERDKDEPTIKA